MAKSQTASATGRLNSDTALAITIRAMAMRSIPVRDPALEALVMRGIDQILAEISACSAR